MRRPLSPSCRWLESASVAGQQVAAQVFFPVGMARDILPKGQKRPCKGLPSDSASVDPVLGANCVGARVGCCCATRCASALPHCRWDPRAAFGLALVKLIVPICLCHDGITCVAAVSFHR